jgi:hypothetical protein
MYRRRSTKDYTRRKISADTWVWLLILAFLLCVFLTWGSSPDDDYTPEGRIIKRPCLWDSRQQNVEVEKMSA